MVDQLIVVLISANSEWQAVKEILAPVRVNTSPFGETFDYQHIKYFQGGWGKVSAAATAQYVIDRYQPHLLVNLGTCGGFEGHVKRGTVILVTKTIIYDIFEQMTDPGDALSHYATGTRHFLAAQSPTLSGPAWSAHLGRPGYRPW